MMSQELTQMQLNLSDTDLLYINILVDINKCQVGLVFGTICLPKDILQCMLNTFYITQNIWKIASC